MELFSSMFKPAVSRLLLCLLLWLWLCLLWLWWLVVETVVALVCGLGFGTGGSLLVRGCLWWRLLWR